MAGEKIKKRMKRLIQKAAGTDALLEQIETLQYFLNHTCDITKVSKASGDLRILQEADAALLAIVDKVCQKHGFTYWMDAGTLLGAVRHQGFIPWDDDIDINMMREDYERALPILREELGKYGIDAVEDKQDVIARIGIGYHHQETGIWVDLFPFEYTTVDMDDPKQSEQFGLKVMEYQQEYEKHRTEYGREQMFNFRREMLPELCEKQKGKSITDCPEWCPHPMLFRPEDIMPPKKISYEGYDFYAPSNPDQYLKTFYGNYMSFPRTGVLHHGDEKGKLENWARLSGTDMQQMIKELQEIYQKI